MKRVAVIQICQESNSFNPVLTTKADFDACGMGTGDEALARFSSGEEVGGFVAGLKNWSEQAVPVGLLLAEARSGGRSQYR